VADPEQARRHEVRPGITGWAQVNGRNAISWEEKFAYDVWYVDHLSLWLDLRIVAKTLAGVVKREGISQAGEATMPGRSGRVPNRDGPGLADAPGWKPRSILHRLPRYRRRDFRVDHQAGPPRKHFENDDRTQGFQRRKS